MSEDDFAKGIVYALARVMELHDEPVVVADVFRESGVTHKQVRQCAEYDVAFLRKAISRLPRGQE